MFRISIINRFGAKGNPIITTLLICKYPGLRGHKHKTAKIVLAYNTCRPTTVHVGLFTDKLETNAILETA